MTSRVEEFTIRLGDPNEPLTLKLAPEPPHPDPKVRQQIEERQTQIRKRLPMSDSMLDE